MNKEQFVPPDSEQEGEQEPILPDVSESGFEGPAVDTVATEALIESACKIISMTLVKLTKIEELEFSDEEIEQLKAVWTPVLPAVSPVMTASLVTIAIVGGKVAIYAAKSKEAKVVDSEKQGSTVP